MIINSKRSLLKAVGDMWLVMIQIAAYIALVTVLDLKYHFEDYKFPVQLLSIGGTVIGLILAFRTNSCYGRWWEARILWGGIVNDSRTWVRQLIEFVGSRQGSRGDNELGEDDVGEVVISALIRQMSLRQIAWCYALSRSLRGQDALADLTGFLDAAELESLGRHTNVPNAILLRQSVDLRRMSRCGELDTYRMVELERTLTRLTDSMGGCERIKNTPFPSSYAWLVHLLVYVLILALPIGLTDMPPLPLFGTSLVMGFGLLIIERVAIFLQDPFSNRPSDTPMLALSRTIEINVKQMLGEKDIPAAAKPDRGVMY